MSIESEPVKLERKEVSDDAVDVEQSGKVIPKRKKEKKPQSFILINSIERERCDGEDEKNQQQLISVDQLGFSALSTPGMCIIPFPAGKMSVFRRSPTWRAQSLLIFSTEEDAVYTCIDAGCFSFALALDD